VIHKKGTVEQRTRGNHSTRIRDEPQRRDGGAKNERKPFNKNNKERL
jgi:hypothetical protein